MKALGTAIYENVITQGLSRDKASKGFEPLISCLLGRRFAQLSHDADAIVTVVT